MWECIYCHEVHEETVELCWQCGSTREGEQPMKFPEPTPKTAKETRRSLPKASFQTEYSFTLPKGYVDQRGNLHRQGTMRLASAADEILPLKDPRVQSNPAYLVIILLSRVVTRLGSLETVDSNVIEGLFASDFAYLQDMYNRINEKETAVINAVCPKCKNKFEVSPTSISGD